MAKVVIYTYLYNIFWEYIASNWRRDGLKWWMPQFVACFFFLTPWTCFEKRLGLSHQRFNLSKAPSEVWFQDHVPTNGNRVNRSIDLASNHCVWFHQSERTRFACRIVLLDKLIFLLICIHFFVIVNLVVLMVLDPMSVEQSKATWTIDETCLFSSMVSLWKITAFQSQPMSYPIYL